MDKWKNIVLHIRPSCLFFCRAFIRRFSTLFFPGTYISFGVSSILQGSDSSTVDPLDCELYSVRRLAQP